METRSPLNEEDYRGTTRDRYTNMKDARETEEGLIDLLQDTAINALRASGQVTLEAVKVTRDVIKGALEAGEDVGTGVADSARSLARSTIGGAIDTAGVLGSSAVSTVSTIIAGMVGGLRQITRAATGDRQNSYNRATSFEDSSYRTTDNPFSTKSDPDLEAELRGEAGSATSAHGSEKDPYVVRGY